MDNEAIKNYLKENLKVKLEIQYDDGGESSYFTLRAILELAGKEISEDEVYCK